MKKILFWVSLIVVLAVFTGINWFIHVNERLWFNTLDYGIEIQPEEHPDSIELSVDFFTDDFHGKGEIEVQKVLVDGKPVEWKQSSDGQFPFHLSKRYQVDSLYTTIVIPFEEAILGRPLQILGAIHYKHSVTQRTDHRPFDIETVVEPRQNDWVFGRIKYPMEVGAYHNKSAQAPE